jgi:hypothetical protein
MAADALGRAWRHWGDQTIDAGCVVFGAYRVLTRPKFSANLYPEVLDFIGGAEGI